MPKTIAIHPFEDGDVVKHWWQWALVGVIAASAGIGALLLIIWLLKALWKHARVR